MTRTLTLFSICALFLNVMLAQDLPHEPDSLLILWQKARKTKGETGSRGSGYGTGSGNPGSSGEGRHIITNRDSSKQIYKSVKPARRGLVKFSENGKFGLKIGDSVICPAQYEWIDFNGMWVGKTTWIKKDGRYGILLRNGQELIPCISEAPLDDIEFSNRNLFRIKQNGKFGVISDSNTFLIPCIYDYLSDDQQGFIVKIEQKTGFLNQQGIPVIPVEMDRIKPLLRGSDLLLATKNGLTGIYELNGKEICPISLTGISPVTSAFHNNSAVMKRFSRPFSQYFVLKNQNGKEAILMTGINVILLDFRFQRICQRFHQESGDVYIVKNKGKFGLADAGGRIVLKLQYDSLVFDCLDDNSGRPLTDFELVAQKRRKFTLIKADGQRLTESDYKAISAAGIYRHNLYRAQDESGFVLINHLGKVLSKQHFRHIGNYANDYAACIGPDGQFAYLDTLGNIMQGYAHKARISYKGGYSSLQTLAEAFAAAILNPHDSALMQFAEKVSPTAYTIDYMERLGFNYRGIPDDMQRHAARPEDFSEAMFKDLKRMQWFSNSHNMEMVRCYFEEPTVVQMQFPGNIKFNESVVILEMKSTEGKTEKLRFKIGELLLIDGCWISFTRPVRL